MTDIKRETRHYANGWTVEIATCPLCGALVDDTSRKGLAAHTKRDHKPHRIRAKAGRSV